MHLIVAISVMEGIASIDLPISMLLVGRSRFWSPVRLIGGGYASMTKARGRACLRGTEAGSVKPGARK